MLASLDSAYGIGKIANYSNHFPFDMAILKPINSDAKANAKNDTKLSAADDGT
jgi:hypothetical protein